MSIVQFPAPAEDSISRTSDIANVRRFVNHHSDRCRWLKERKRITRFDEKRGRWVLEAPFDLWAETVQATYVEASLETDSQTRKALAGWARQSESTRRYQAAMVGLQALPEFAISLDAFDNDPYLINAQNCAIDLSSGKVEVRPHRANDFCFQQLGAAYDSSAVPKVFLSALSRSLPDDDIRHAFQIVMGQSLVAKVFQRLPIITGRGAEGKTTLSEAVQRVYGSYATTIDSSTLAESRRNGASASPDIAGTL